MKRVFLFFIVFGVLFTSCNMGMLGRYSDYYYYSSNKSTSGDSGPGADIEIPNIEVDPDKDPFIQGEWNKPDYKFDGSVFDSWLLKVEFDGSNIPQYGFFEDGTQWTESQVKVGYPEVSFNADKRGWKAQGYGMNPLSIYRYDHKNPLIAVDGTYNNSDRLQRFLFYRIIGEAVVVDLDQYLIAVDTYSKFVFAYAKVTSTTTVVGNKVPNGFGPVESYGEKRFFYEYDPIGYVDEKGTVTLYKSYIDEMRKSAVDYFPSIHNKVDMTMATHSPSGEGRSPYYTLDLDSVTPIPPEEVEEFLKSLSEKMYLGRATQDVSYVDATGAQKQISVPGETRFSIKFGIAEDKKITATYTVGDVTEELEFDGTTTEVYGNSLPLKNANKEIKVSIVNATCIEFTDNNRKHYGYTDFQDTGVHFLLQTKGCVYEVKNSTGAYIFVGADAKIHDIKENMVYAFSPKDSDSATSVTYVNSKGKEATVSISDNGNTLKIDNSLTGPSDREAVRVPVPADPKSLIQGKTFKFRDYSEYVPTGTDKIPSGYKSTGKSKILYEYSFDNAATTVSYYATEYMKDRRLVGTYSLTQEDSVFAFNKDGTDITLVVPAEGLITDGETMYQENFTDHGPIFVDRVAGAVFTNGGISYTFSEDGLSFVLKDGSKTWNYTFARFDNALTENYTAVYQFKDSTFGYGRVVLIPRNNTMRNDVIRVSTVGGTIGGLGDGGSDAGLGYEAYRGQTVTDFFIENVAGKSYVVRDGLALYTYQFDESGSHAVLKRQLWNTQEETEVAEMALTFATQESGTKATYNCGAPESGNYRTVTVELQDQNKYFVADSKTYTESTQFQDLGPEFYYRVQGKTFVYRDDYDNAELVFSADGKTLTDTHDGTVYVLSSVDTTNHTQAKYKVQNGKNYYPLRLEENDTVLTWGTGFSLESWVSYDTCGKYPADLKRD